MDADFLMAIRLQEQFDKEYETSRTPSHSLGGDSLVQSNKKRKVEIGEGSNDVVSRWKSPTVNPERPLSIVDESWETLDPNPDVRTMFLQFNDMFFWGKLCGVEVKWSPRMTLCAGVCSYEGRGGLCSIRLSEPLLKLRPRKDLVETLLHEMIHALLFVTNNDRDRDGHGPEFCKHMYRINKASGTKITVYHSFHDEVDVYRQHWWKCNGPCQHRRPYFGFVKRAMNRAPSSLDPWWEEHRRTCGGTYVKVKEPEGYGTKGKKNSKKDGKTAEVSGSQDIRNIIPFSGNGFVLGGRSQVGKPVGKAQTSGVASTPMTLFPPSSPSKTPSSLPPLSAFSGRTNPSSLPSSRPAGLSGPNAPIKRSVSNTKVFVNINGSPVRIYKPSICSGGQEVKKVKQRSIDDLLSGAKFRDPAGTASTSSRLKDSATSPFFSPPRPAQPCGGATGGSARATQPSGSQASKKRPLDDSRGSTIYDFFRRTSGGGSVNAESPSVRSGAATVVSPSSSAPSSSFTPSFPAPTPSSSISSSSSYSSSALMVNCPVCQARVLESKINEHLDYCL